MTAAAGECTYSFRGQDKAGNGRTGVVTTADLVEWVRIRHLAGWRWLEVISGGFESGGISVLVESGGISVLGGKRSWWVER